MALNIKEFSDMQIEEAKILLKETKRKLEVAKSIHNDAIKHESNADDMIKQIEAMIVQTELHMTSPAENGSSQSEEINDQMPLMRNSTKKEKNMIQRPKVPSVLITNNYCLDEAYKTLNMALHIKKISNMHVKESRIVLDEAERKFKSTKHIFHDVLEWKRKTNDQIIQTEEMVAKVELSVPTQWNKMYEKLVNYKEQYGNCLVPLRCTNDPELNTLGRWVGNQRFFYKKYKSGKTHQITMQRISALDKLGFVWDLNDYRWESKYKQLVEHITKTANCLIPSIHDANPRLGVWCNTQINQWYRLKKGLPNTLSDYRITALNDVGFFDQFRKKSSAVFNSCETN
eukprot:CAMPEP_0195512884 /NCGR_PEP_ID=MMETSP0794_2-20130614/4685_1 /TAXON_ID=515487 /ORGANISM="Stephanopyxis turris, Strain CCMP 815" /LENGTH=342 /DNA_ID=CAMNT_0040640763 /DNA_START=271 /DNA_END=1296 /DNA_ORIENTATION=+